MTARNYFLIDALGAFLSAFLLGFVLVYFQKHIGMPVDVLYLLATFPFGFFIYDLIILKMRWWSNPLFLKGISIANFTYCLLSLWFLIQHFELLAIIGTVYFICELILVCCLALLEWNVATRKT